jgi:hypothetical protein
VQENSFFLPSDFEIWDVRFFFSYCCPAILLLLPLRFFLLLSYSLQSPGGLIP